MADLKLVYKEFSGLLDSNYAAGRAISKMQSKRGTAPITEEVICVFECTSRMLESYVELSQTPTQEAEELGKKLTGIGKAALAQARTHDSLLKGEDPSAAKYCLPGISELVSSTRDEMCHPKDPEKFLPKNIGSLQDAMRYIHERSIETVFEKMSYAHSSGKIYTGAKELVAGHSHGSPARISAAVSGAKERNWGRVLIMDLGGAISDSAAQNRTVEWDDVTSEPLLAIGGSLKNTASVKVFASRDFMSAQVELGVLHKATVEAMIRKGDFVEGENYAANNYIRLRYIDSGFDGSEYRLGYMSKILEGAGFKVEDEGPRSIGAEQKRRYPDSTEKALRTLFRLLDSCDCGMEVAMGNLVEKKMEGDAKITKEEAASSVIDMTVKEFEKGNRSIYDFLIGELNRKDNRGF